MKIKRGYNKFYIGENEENCIAEITWLPKWEGILLVNHTYVNKLLRGQGVASKLLDELVKMVREEGLKIVPTCSYVVDRTKNNKEYSDILYADEAYKQRVIESMRSNL